MKVYLITLTILVFILPSCSLKQVSTIEIIYKEFQLNVGNGGSPRMIKWKLSRHNNIPSIWNMDLTNNIYSYRLADASQNKNINIPSQGPGSADFSDFFIGEKELILNSPLGVYTYDFQGNQLSKLLFSSIDTLGISEKFVNLRTESNFWFDPNNFDIQSGKLFFFYYNRAKTFDEQPIIASVETKSGEIELFETPIPVNLGLSAPLSNSLDLMNYHYPSLSVAGDKLVCSFGGFNEFYYVETDDLNNSDRPVWNEVQIKSEFSIPKFRSNPVANINASTSIIRQNAYFGPIKWDPFRRLYYRISYLPTDPNDDNVKAKPILLVMDSNFTKLAEIKLDRKLRLRAWHVGKEGIYTLMWSDVENTVKFQIIEVNPG